MVASHLKVERRGCNVHQMSMVIALRPSEVEASKHHVALLQVVAIGSIERGIMRRNDG